MNEGASFFAEVAADRWTTALAAVLAELGYRAVDQGAAAGAAPSGAAAPTIELIEWRGPAGCSAGLELPASSAQAWGARLASRLGAPVHVITASLTHARAAYGCVLDDQRYEPDGRQSAGRWASDMMAAEGWDGLCDGKPDLLVGIVLQLAAEDFAGSVIRTTRQLARAASLGTPRLDALAAQMRAANQVTRATVAGRECVRITTAGATVVSFLDPHELQALQHAGLLAP